MASSSISTALYAAVTMPATRNAVPENSKELSHHVKNGKGFANPWASWREWGAFEIFRAISGRRLSGKGRSPDTTPPTVPIRKPELLPSRETETLRATWLGHACYYVEFPGGLRALFDPVFTDRCSPFSWLGPKRYTPAPCKIEELPFVDICVISHAHYDHLSYETVLAIQKKYPNVHFFAPLGNKKWFSACGIDNMTEMDWWDDREILLSPQKSQKGTGSSASSLVQSPPEANAASSPGPGHITASISCLPCQHTAARTLTDKNHTLWSSWSVASGGKKVYFGGDTGYRAVPEELPESASVEFTPELHGKYPHCPAFKEIGDLRGPFDLGLIPIGAYAPRFIMSAMHANPFDSVNIFKDTKCKKAMGIHWGTWVLTEEDVLEPPRILKEALKCNGIAEEGVFDVCDIGESREFH